MESLSPCSYSSALLGAAAQLPIVARSPIFTLASAVPSDWVLRRYHFWIGTWVSGDSCQGPRGLSIWPSDLIAALRDADVGFGPALAIAWSSTEAASQLY